jgi:hypothetical protein
LFERFQHYLSYGSTDQQTVRDLAGLYDGLLVPGTIAAFQAEGTKGFVLTLSASSGAPYVIDSRFPLFQNDIAEPKKSHGMLAAVLGVPELLGLGRAPVPADFTDEIVTRIAQRWIDFNNDFEDVKTKTFDKYAARLGEPVLPENRQKPAYILPPYLMVENAGDGWWEISSRIWDASVEYGATLGIGEKLRRVVAVRRAAILGDLVVGIPENQAVEWVSNLDEFRIASEPELVSYGNALQRAKDGSKALFALYGGFFSVLMARFGLVGSSHGVGFGEHRDWVELPSSGAPPARYYVPRLHRYVGVDIAIAIWRQFPSLIECACDECNGGSPGALDYHQLMKHSVRVRAREIADWLDLPTIEVRQLLDRDFLAFSEALRVLDAPEQLRRRAEDIHLHLPMWSRVLDQIN